MIKRLISSILLVGLISLLIYVGHQYLLNNLDIELQFSLLSTYFFYIVTYILVTIAIELVNRLDPIYTGMAYMWSFLVKLMLFGIFFYSSLFGEETLPFGDRLSIIAPMLIYILFEVLYCIKIIELKEDS
jgi:hypothetical protein